MWRESVDLDLLAIAEVTRILSGIAVPGSRCVVESLIKTGICGCCPVFLWFLVTGVLIWSQIVTSDGVFLC